jgi:V/A-type H+-transporting ATPase subunit A
MKAAKRKGKQKSAVQDSVVNSMMKTGKRKNNGGVIHRVAGPVVVARGMDARMHDVVLVGKERLLGEVIQITGDRTTIQVYEDTCGVAPKEPVVSTGRPLTVELGPGLLTSIYDGIQRSLPQLVEERGDFIDRGAQSPALDQERRWKFIATARNNTLVRGGDRLGYVDEFEGFRHHIMVPPDNAGTLSGLRSGEFTVNDTIGFVEQQSDDGARRMPLRLKQTWPVRVPRPVTRRLAPEQPLITGQRVVDALFPIAKGGTAIISGPFGSGKTVLQHQLAKWSDADIIVYVGCGERGNEMTEVLTEFPALKDPRKDAPLMHRTVLIANTSNMPVAAREASIYTGVTIGEYFRDMGYDVAMMADSTSRWAEALREIGSRLEEMPGEEGYPAYLSSRIAAFYERAARVVPLSERKDDKEEGGKNDVIGSLTIVGAVSPPGGDFFEPVTQSSLRVTKAFWALDAKIAQRRQYPSINWLDAYSLYSKSLAPWYARNMGDDWPAMVLRFKAILQEESQLLEIVQLVGSDSLPIQQQVTLHIARLIRESFLHQQAFDPLDSYSPLKNTHALMRLITAYADACQRMAGSGASMRSITDIKISDRIHQCKYRVDMDVEATRIEKDIRAMGTKSDTDPDPVSAASDTTASSDSSNGGSAR